VEGRGHRQLIYMSTYHAPRNRRICSRLPAQEHGQKSVRSSLYLDLPQSAQRWRRAGPRFYHTGHVEGMGNGDPHESAVDCGQILGKVSVY
jgi:hypothetical protein